MSYGRKMRGPGLGRKLKFSDNFCQIFPGRTILSIVLKIQRSRADGEKEKQSVMAGQSRVASQVQKPIQS